MRSERSLARLAEMGIDAWVPRSRVVSRDATPAAAADDGVDPSRVAATRGQASITIVGDLPSGNEPRWLEDLRRALRMAGVDSVVASRNPSSLDGPAIVFGLQRALADASESRIDCIHCAGWPTLRRDPQARRALWRDIATLLRTLSDAKRAP